MSEPMSNKCRSTIECQITKASENVRKDITALASDGGFYARGLASEGYVGGYHAALQDVLLLLNGVTPNRKYWEES